MVTSSGRLIIAPAGGEEKKAKYDIALHAPGTEYSSSTDAKGITQWVVDTVCSIVVGAASWLTYCSETDISCLKTPSLRRVNPWPRRCRRRNGLMPS
jgi:hypothetical protein